VDGAGDPGRALLPMAVVAVAADHRRHNHPGPRWGLSRWRPTATSCRIGVLLGGTGDRRPSVGGNVLHARLATAQLASWTRAAGKRGGTAVSHRISHATSQQPVRPGGIRAWGAAEPAAVDRRITVSWLTSVLGEGFAPSTSLVTWKGRCPCRLGFQTLRTTW
jgi:hypothetical protein